MRREACGRISIISSSSEHHIVSLTSDSLAQIERGI